MGFDTGNAFKTGNTGGKQKVQWFKETEETRQNRNTGFSSRCKFFEMDGLKEFYPKDFTKDGLNKIRILPHNMSIWDNNRGFGMPVYVHKGVGERFEVYLCLKKMKNERCPICERSDQLLASNNKADITQGKKIKTTLSVIYLLVDRNDDEEAVNFWLAPYTKIDKVIYTLQKDEDGAIIPIVDPEEGHDVIFTYNKPSKGASMADIGNVYPDGGVRISRKSSPVANDVALEYVATHAIPDLLKFYSYDEMATALYGDTAHNTTIEEIMEEDSAVDETTTEAVADVDTDEPVGGTHTAEEVREMSDEDLTKILLDNGVKEDDVVDMTLAEKRKMVSNNTVR